MFWLALTIAAALIYFYLRINKRNYIVRQATSTYERDTYKYRLAKWFFIFITLFHFVIMRPYAPEIKFITMFLVIFSIINILIRRTILGKKSYISRVVRKRHSYDDFNDNLRRK